MPTTIGTAYVQILPTTEGIGSNLTSALSGPANDAASAAGESSGGLLGSGIAKGLIGAGAAITAAAGAAVAGVTALVGSTAEYGDNIDKASQKLGVSSSFYQEWDAVLQHSGTSMDSMSATFKTLANAAQDASDDQVAAFAALGMSMEDVASMSREDLFENVIAGLQNMEEGTERAAIANDLLGRGSTELGALFNTSAEDTQAMIDKVNELGGVMSEDAVKAAAAYEDSLQDMKTGFGAIKNSIGAELIPVFTDLMNMVIENMPEIKAIIEPVVSAIGEWVGNIATWVTEHSGTITGAIDGVSIVISTAWGVIEQIFSALSGAITTVSSTFQTEGVSMEGVWTGISAAIQIAGDLISAVITAVGNAIAWLVTEAQTDGSLINIVWQGIQNAISTAVSVISGVINAVIALLNGDFAGAWESIKGVISSVWDGIKTSISTKLTLIKTLITTALNAIKTTFTTIFASVKTSVTSVFEGIRSTISSKIEAAKTVVSNGLNAIKNFFSNLVLKLPDIKLPHFSLTGSFSINPPSVPSISVEWYGKAMDSAMLLDGATLFGAAGGKLLGGGERGREYVSGESHLKSLIRETVSSVFDDAIRGIEQVMVSEMYSLSRIVAYGSSMIGHEAASKRFPDQHVELTVKGKTLARAIAHDVGGYMEWEVL